MRILQILPELNVGGVERGTVDFSKYLVDHGHQSIVISNGGSLVSRIKKDGATHVTLPVHKKSLLTAYKMIKEVRQIILKYNIEVVHARSRVPAWIAYFATRKTKASFITTCHGHYSKRWYSQIMGWSKLVIVPSQMIARHMIDFYKVPKERIRVIPRSVDLNLFKFKSKQAEGKSSFIITIIGRITPLKGHTYFLKSMARVVRSMPNVRIQIIGDPPKRKAEYKEELVELTRRLGIKDYVDFLGSKSNVQDYLRKSDVLVLSSIEPESFGRVVVEAQAVGVPVVATSVGGVVDIIEHEKNGLLVMPKDIEAMAREVLRLLKEPALVKQITLDARKRVEEKYTLDHMAEHILSVYQELLKKQNILVIKFGAIGDVVLIVPSLRRIRKHFPDAKIYCITSHGARKVLQNCPYIDHLIVMNVHDQQRGWWEVLRHGNKSRKYSFDYVIDLQNNRKSHFLAWYIFPKISIGFDNKKWSRLLTNPIKNYQKNLPAVDHQFQILEGLGIKPGKSNLLELWPSAKDRQYVQTLLDSEWMGNSRQFVGLNVSASSKWPTKNWPIEYVAELCDLLAEYNIRVILTGMNKDLQSANEIAQLTKAKPALLVGKTDILQLAVVIERCGVYLTPDSAPLHVAAAMKTPIIAFFGPTSPERHLPPGDNITVLSRNLPCMPCYSGQCKINTHACMREIATQDVFDIIMSTLKIEVKT